MIWGFVGLNLKVSNPIFWQTLEMEFPLNLSYITSPMKMTYTAPFTNISCCYYLEILVLFSRKQTTRNMIQLQHIIIDNQHPHVVHVQSVFVPSCGCFGPATYFNEGVLDAGRPTFSCTEGKIHSFFGFFRVFWRKNGEWNSPFIKGPSFIRYQCTCYSVCINKYTHMQIYKYIF